MCLESRKQPVRWHQQFRVAALPKYAHHLCGLVRTIKKKWMAFFRCRFICDLIKMLHYNGIFEFKRQWHHPRQLNDNVHSIIRHINCIFQLMARFFHIPKNYLFIRWKILSAHFWNAVQNQFDVTFYVIHLCERIFYCSLLTCDRIWA